MSLVQIAVDYGDASALWETMSSQGAWIGDVLGIFGMNNYRQGKYAISNATRQHVIHCDDGLLYRCPSGASLPGAVLLLWPIAHASAHRMQQDCLLTDHLGSDRACQNRSEVFSTQLLLISGNHCE
jgi:hypothetical protein